MTHAIIDNNSLSTWTMQEADKGHQILKYNNLLCTCQSLVYHFGSLIGLASRGGNALDFHWSNY